MDRAEAVREMTFEEEAVLYQQEAKAIFAKEDEGYEAPPINHTVRRGMRIIRKAREEIAALREQEPKGVEIDTVKNEWISVEERLPKSIANKVLVCCKNGYVGFGHYEKFCGKEVWYNLESGVAFVDWDLEDCETYEVTHWMPLPEPPKEGEDR